MHAFCLQPHHCSETARRVKTQLLIEVEEMLSVCRDAEQPRVVLLAATNLPWELGQPLWPP